MSAADQGGPAFPSNRDMRHSPDWDYEPGISALDYFAAKAMQTLLSIPPSEFRGEKAGTPVGEVVARKSYSMAEFMLAERQRRIK